MPIVARLAVEVEAVVTIFVDRQSISLRRIAPWPWRSPRSDPSGGNPKCSSAASHASDPATIIDILRHPPIDLAGWRRTRYFPRLWRPFAYFQVSKLSPKGQAPSIYPWPLAERAGPV
jgi:hypothetical protein